MNDVLPIFLKNNTLAYTVNREGDTLTLIARAHLHQEDDVDHLGPPIATIPIPVDAWPSIVEAARQVIEEEDE